MTTSHRTHRSQTAANAFGALGYLSLLFQWMWSLILLAYPVITDPNSTLLQHSARPTIPSPTTQIDVNPFMAGLLIIITMIILGFAVITIVRLPKTIGKTGARLTRSTTNLILPAITHHEPIAPARRRLLSFKIILALKAALILLPLISLLFAPAIPELTRTAGFVVGAFCAIGSSLYFAIQYIIARLGRVKMNALW